MASRRGPRCCRCPGGSPEVIVEEPQPFDIVDEPIRIAGIGGAFEGTIATRVLDADGNTLARSFVRGGAFALRTFHGELAVGAVPPTPQDTLEVGPAPVSDEGPRRAQRLLLRRRRLEPGGRRCALA